MKIVIDDKIPMLKGVLEPYAEVYYYDPFEISKEIVKDKDALIIRTRTKCDSELLEGSSVKFIATATIGHDHIDAAYCDAAGIKWMNAPGCNSVSVMQYVSSALITIAERKNFELKDKTLGVVGAGNVGSKVAKTAKLLGMKVLLNDPPRARKEGQAGFTELEELVSLSDIITFHVPLNKEGADKTYHIIEDSFLGKINGGKIIFNSSRGQIAETNALKNALKQGIIEACVLDVWENEPAIDRELLGLVDIATPHIAGYSSDGKANGTAACVRGLSEYFNLGIAADWYPVIIPMPENEKQILIDCNGITDLQTAEKAIMASYNILQDDKALRNSVETFERQRGGYPVRREFSYYDVKLLNGNREAKKILADLGFNLKD